MTPDRNELPDRLQMLVDALRSSLFDPSDKVDIEDGVVSITIDIMGDGSSLAFSHIDAAKLYDRLREHFAAEFAMPIIVIHEDGRQEVIIPKHVTLEARIRELEDELAAAQAPKTVHIVVVPEPSNIRHCGLWTDKTKAEAYAKELGGWVQAVVLNHAHPADRGGDDGVHDA